MIKKSILVLLFATLMISCAWAQDGDEDVAVDTGADGDEDVTGDDNGSGGSDNDNNGVQPNKNDRVCNICGCVGCDFVNPIGVVWFTYKNKQEKRPCQQLQQEVNNPTIYNTTYCKTVIWKAAYEPCQCVNYEGDLLTDIEGETIVMTMAPEKGLLDS